MPKKLITKSFAKLTPMKKKRPCQNTGAMSMVSLDHTAAVTRDTVPDFQHTHFVSSSESLKSEFSDVKFAEISPGKKYLPSMYECQQVPLENISLESDESDYEVLQQKIDSLQPAKPMQLKDHLKLASKRKVNVSSINNTLANHFKRKDIALKPRMGVYDGTKRKQRLSKTKQQIVDEIDHDLGVHLMQQGLKIGPGFSDDSSIDSDATNGPVLKKMQAFNRRVNPRQIFWRSQRESQSTVNQAREASQAQEDIATALSQNSVDDIVDREVPPVVPRDQLPLYFLSPRSNHESEVAPDGRSFVMGTGGCGDCCGLWREKFADANPDWFMDSFGCDRSHLLRELFQPIDGFLWDKNYNQVQPLILKPALYESIFDQLQVNALHRTDIAEIKSAAKRKVAYKKIWRANYDIIRKLLYRLLRPFQPDTRDQYLWLPSLKVSIAEIQVTFSFKQPSHEKVVKPVRAKAKPVRRREWAWNVSSKAPLKGDLAQFIPKLIPLPVEGGSLDQQKKALMTWFAPQ